MDRVEGWGAGDTGPDRLVHGREPSRPTRTRALLVGTLLVALGGTGAWHLLHGRDEDTARPGGIGLAAGTVRLQDRQPPSPGLLVTVHNDSDRPVTVLNVGPPGWPAITPRTRIRPGGRAAVPLDVVVKCADAPPVDQAFVVSAAPGGRSTHVLRLSRVPTVRTGKYQRLCLLDAGPVPRRREVLGIWLVEPGRDLAGRMLIRLDAGGTVGLARPPRTFRHPGGDETFDLHHGGIWIAGRAGRPRSAGR